MSHLFHWITFRHLFQDRGRALLTLAGVAIGVAVFVSVRLANTSAMASFSDTVDAIAGSANLQIVADSEGFDETIFPSVRRTSGVTAAAPVVQTYVRARPGSPPPPTDRTDDEAGPYRETLLVMGIDVLLEAPFARYTGAANAQNPAALLAFLADPTGVAITRTLSERHRLNTGDTLTVLSTGRPIPLTVRYILESDELQHALGGNVALMDIGAAQEVFGRSGKLDRIDLRVDPLQRQAVTERLRPLLPPQASVGSPQNRTRQVENMVSAFALSLTALSAIALFVSIFLVFNAVAMSVLRRRREIGLLRSIGVTRRQVLFLFLGEAFVIGVAGSLIGLGLGTLMAQGSLRAVSQTLTTLYLVAHASTLHYDALTYGIGLALGVLVSLAAALAPAIEASRTAPALTVRQGILLEVMTVRVARWTAAGAGILFAAALVAVWTLGRHSPWGGFVSAFLTLGGFSLLAPAFTVVCERVADRLLTRFTGVEGRLGARYLREAVARTSIAAAALMTAVGMMVGMSIMVGSFRQTVDLWITQSIRGDLYVQPVGRRANGGTTALPEDIPVAAARLPGVAAVDTYRGARISYGDRFAYVMALDLDVHRQHGRLRFMDGKASTDVLGEAIARDGVAVTESFAYRHRVDTGDSVTLYPPTGRVRLPIVGVYYDYNTDAGSILMDRRLFGRLWQTSRAESMALYLSPDAHPDEVRQRLLTAVDDRIMLHITPNQEIRRQALTVFDQTFRITYALQAIAIVVAALGVITTLTALILQRGREIGVLRATGAFKTQIRKMVLVESGLIGMLGAVMGSLCGVALAVLLIYVINKQFFGWSIRMYVAPGIFVQAFAIMVATALLAGLAPARRALKRAAAEAMRLELVVLAVLLGLTAPASAQTDASGYRLAVAPYTFVFPRDHASHPEFRTEWWYYTGHLFGDGRSFGYELTFFQVGINPARRASPSRWALHTLYFAHFAVTDQNGNRFYHTENIARPALDMAGALEDRYRVWIGDWSAGLTDSTTHRLEASSAMATISLDLKPEKPPVIHGHDGVSRKAEGEGRASHYYSLTRMATSGTLTLNDKKIPVTGLSWMDHEFGSNQLTPQQQGWDWFSIQLDNRRELMLYLMRRKDGTYEPVSSGTVVDTDGSWRHLDRSGFEIAPTGTWESPYTRAAYPSGWTVRVPSEGMELTVTPTVKNQELGTGSLIGVVYWEGSVKVEGKDQGNPVRGLGYVELTGYAGRVPGI
ncbi:MAG: FtsX-like permease family protein [candidate division Zixibacteria bacterium]|nr:FtsX-like permease family protein [candidate division Zixibacteria bacterium]